MFYYIVMCQYFQNIDPLLRLAKSNKEMDAPNCNTTLKGRCSEPVDSVQVSESRAVAVDI